MHLFAGAGGGILADILLGHQPVCAVEINEYCQQVLSARQKDGFLPWFPIFDDVTQFDGRPWRGVVDVVAGGFPCQDISVAGKGAGIDGERSGLWSEMARIISEVRPRYAFVENSPALITRGLGRVIGDLAALGYDCRWGVLGAADVGAPHQRDRLWIVAYSDSRNAECRQSERPGIYGEKRGEGSNNNSCGPSEESKTMAHPNGMRELQPQGCQFYQRGRTGDCGKPAHVPDGDGDCVQWLEPESQPGGYERPAGLHDRARSIQPWSADPADAPESRLGRVANGVANRVDRLKAIGNGQVPLCAATAWRMLTSL